MALLVLSTVQSPAVHPDSQRIWVVCKHDTLSLCGSSYLKTINHPVTVSSVGQNSFANLSYVNTQHLN